MRSVLVENQVARAAPGRSRNVEQTLQAQRTVEPAVAKRAHRAVEESQDMDTICSQIHGQQEIAVGNQLVDVRRRLPVGNRSKPFEMDHLRGAVQAAGPYREERHGPAGIVGRQQSPVVGISALVEVPWDVDQMAGVGRSAADL